MTRFWLYFSLQILPLGWLLLVLLTFVHSHNFFTVHQILLRCPGHEVCRQCLLVQGRWKWGQCGDQDGSNMVWSLSIERKIPPSWLLLPEHPQRPCILVLLRTANLLTWVLMRELTINIFHALEPCLGNIHWHWGNCCHQPGDHGGHKMTENAILKFIFWLINV